LLPDWVSCTLGTKSGEFESNYRKLVATILDGCPVNSNAGAGSINHTFHRSHKPPILDSKKNNQKRYK